MPYFKRFLIVFILIILSVLSGCAGNTDDIFDESAPLTEIITGTMSFMEKINKEEVMEMTEIAEIIETVEITTLENKTEEDTDLILYVTTPSGKKYHYETCRTVKNIKQYITKDEAIQSGFEPCKICNPK